MMDTKNYHWDLVPDDPELIVFSHVVIKKNFEKFRKSVLALIDRKIEIIGIFFNKTVIIFQEMWPIFSDDGKDHSKWLILL